jgi:hypothetical protein
VPALSAPAGDVGFGAVAPGFPAKQKGAIFDIRSTFDSFIQIKNSKQTRNFVLFEF